MSSFVTISSGSAAGMTEGDRKPSCVPEGYAGAGIEAAISTVRLGGIADAGCSLAAGVPIAEGGEP